MEHYDRCEKAIREMISDQILVFWHVHHTKVNISGKQTLHSLKYQRVVEVITCKMIEEVYSVVETGLDTKY